MKEVRKNINLHAFGEEIRRSSESYKYKGLTYRTNVSGETDVEIEDITEGFLIHTSPPEVEVGTPVTITVETPEDRRDVLVSIKSGNNIVDLVRVNFPSTVNAHGWRGTTLTWTPEHAGVYEIGVDGGRSIAVRVYRRAGGVQ